MSDENKNNIWLAIQYTLSLLISFLTLKMNLIHYGQELFGSWIIIASLWGISSVIDFGFGTAIVKYVAMAKYKNDLKNIKTILTTGFIFFSIIGIAIICLGYILAVLFLFGNKKIFPLQSIIVLKHVFILLGISFYFQYLTILFKSIFEGYNKFTITSGLTILYNVTILISVFIVSIFNLSIEYLSGLYLVSSIFILFTYFIVLKIKLKEIYFKLTYIDFSLFRKMFTFSINVQFATLFGGLIDPIIKFLIGNYSSITLVPLYEIARKFSQAISGLFVTTFKTILPKTSVLSSKEEYFSFISNEGILLSSIGVSFSGIVFGICSIVFVSIIKLWFGFEVSIFIFFLLALPESLNIIGYTNYIFLMGIGKAGYLMMMQFINLLLITGCIYIGLLLFQSYLGLIGYYISVLCVNIIILFLIKKETEINIKDFLNRIGIIKIFCIHALFLILIVANIFIGLNLFVMSSVLSLISFLLFKNDLYKNAIVIKEKINQFRKINVIKTKMS